MRPSCSVMGGKERGKYRCTDHRCLALPQLEVLILLRYFILEVHLPMLYARSRELAAIARKLASAASENNHLSTLDAVMSTISRPARSGSLCDIAVMNLPVFQVPSAAYLRQKLHFRIAILARDESREPFAGSQGMGSSHSKRSR